MTISNNVILISFAPRTPGITRRAAPSIYLKTVVSAVGCMPLLDAALPYGQFPNQISCGKAAPTAFTNFSSAVTIRHFSRTLKAK